MRQGNAVGEINEYNACWSFSDLRGYEMGEQPIIYCIEGHHDQAPEPSVESMLTLLHTLGHWDYVRRNAATADEMFYWLKHEWGHCQEGSILYFATHGAEGEIWLSSHEDHSSSVPIEKLAMEADCSNCLVHFGGCATIAGNKDRIQSFMDSCGAIGVSGYGAEVGWADRWRPALALEMMLFSSIRVEEIHLADGRSNKRLTELRDDLQARFPECQFNLQLRQSKAS